MNLLVVVILAAVFGSRGLGDQLRRWRVGRRDGRVRKPAVNVQRGAMSVNITDDRGGRRQRSGGGPVARRLSSALGRWTVRATVAVTIGPGPRVVAGRKRSGVTRVQTVVLVPGAMRALQRLHSYTG